MNRLISRTLCCALGLLLVAGCGGTKPDSSKDASAEFGAAADALSAKFTGTSAPAASDPAVANFDKVTGDALQTLGTPALPVDGFNSFDALCGQTAKVVGGYINVGVAAAPEASRAELIQRNAAQYLDQMFPPLLFSGHCTAAHTPFIEESIDADDLRDKKAALAQVRDGSYAQAMGLIQMAGATDLDAARKARIMDLLVRDAGNFGIAFSRQQRGALAAMLDSLPEDARAKAAEIKESLEQAPCGKLCSM